MVEQNPVQSKSEKLKEGQDDRAKVRKNLRLKGRTKGKEKEKKGPKLGAGGAKGAKEMAENELETKLEENEEKRRQWLMTWHLEVDQMHTDLWDMQQTLATSLVRTESAKARDREKRFTVAKPQMTEEEIEKLPVRMRPRPKYKPYMSNREMSDVNDRSYRKIIRNLHDSPRKFDMTPDNEDRLSSSRSRFPQIQVSGADFDRYRLLLLKNPFNKNREREDFLQRSKTDFLKIPAGPGKPYYKIQTTRSAEVVASSLPHLKVPSNNMPADAGFGNGGSKTKVAKDNSLLSPLSRENKQQQDINKAALSPVNETTIKGGVPSSPSPSISLETDSVCSAADSDESGHMMAIKARNQAAKAALATSGSKKLVDKGEGGLGMPEKHQPNLLDDANFRKTLIETLDQKRQERARDNKWGMVKNAFKVTGMLKVKMPDVIKDQAKSKHHNRAIDQVQERMKARQDVGGGGSDGNGGGGMGLNRRMSQSMGASNTGVQY